MTHSWSNFKDKLEKWCKTETNLIGQTYTYKYIPEKECCVVELNMYNHFKAKRVITKDNYYQISNKDVNDNSICSLITQNLKKKYKDRDHLGFNP